MPLVAVTVGPLAALAAAGGSTRFTKLIINCFMWLTLLC